MIDWPRIVGAVSAAVGVMACFAPWVQYGPFTVAGFDGQGLLVAAGYLAGGVALWFAQTRGVIALSMVLFSVGVGFAGRVMLQVDVGVLAVGVIVAVSAGVVGVLAGLAMLGER